MAPPDPSVTRIDGPWRHLDVHANGIRFHVVEATPDDQDTTAPTARPLVIMLHGFGSFWWSWRHQLRGLTGARVVAVDLRGYGGSDKPPRGYDGWTLAGDTAGLIRALGHTSATLVGHADGGLVDVEHVVHPAVPGFQRHLPNGDALASKEVHRLLVLYRPAGRVELPIDQHPRARLCRQAAPFVPRVHVAYATKERRNPRRLRNSSEVGDGLGLSGPCVETPLAG